MKSNRFFSAHFFVVIALTQIFFLSACTASSNPVGAGEKLAASSGQAVPEVKNDSASKTIKTNHPVRGPETAPLKIEQFSDFFCPYCKKQASVFNELRKNYPDKIQMTFRHFPLSGEPGMGSFPMHEASVCASEQGKFWEFHDHLFLSKDRLSADDVAKAIGLNEVDFKSCMQAEHGRGVVLEDLADAQARRVNGAPTFFINGEKMSGLRPYDFFVEKIDPVFAQKAADTRAKAQAELLEKIDPSETGRPMVGSEKALVTITEFSDFHCPFCVRLTGTLQKVMDAYPQDVRRVWRHFPLPIHPYSPYAHLASECAHEQGRFWDFHAKIFADPGAAHSGQDFDRIAESLKLDLPKFKACFESPQTKKKVENDVLLGMYRKVASTPTFFVNDELFIGAKSFDDIKAIVERKLAEAKKKPEAK